MDEPSGGLIEPSAEMTPPRPVRLQPCRPLSKPPFMSRLGPGGGGGAPPLFGTLPGIFPVGPGGAPPFFGGLPGIIPLSIGVLVSALTGAALAGFMGGVGGPAGGSTLPGFRNWATWIAWVVWFWKMVF